LPETASGESGAGARQPTHPGTQREYSLRGGAPAILGYVRTVISIPDSLFSAAQRRARLLGVSRNELFQRANRAFLQDYEGGDVTDCLNRVYGSTGTKAKIDPLIERIQLASVTRRP